MLQQTNVGVLVGATVKTIAVENEIGALTRFVRRKSFKSGKQDNSSFLWPVVGYESKQTDVMEMIIMMIKMCNLMYACLLDGSSA